MTLLRERSHQACGPTILVVCLIGAGVTCPTAQEASPSSRAASADENGVASPGSESDKGLAPTTAEPAPSATAPAAGAASGSAAAAEGASGDAGEVRLGVYRGTVTDRRSGKPVPEALVIFINEETGESFQTTTGRNGIYEINLPEGEYIVDIQVGRKVYRSSGSFKEEATGRRWVMDFTVGSKLTEKDLKILTTSEDVRLVPTEPRPPLEPSRKMAEFFIFLGGVLGVAALAN